jgi:hypothetical protein
VHPDEQGLRKRAHQELPPQLLALAAAHGVTVTRVSIRNQRSRWGACSSRGSITLNWRLILVPPFVREYVMIHELMHRRELIIRSVSGSTWPRPVRNTGMPARGCCQTGSGFSPVRRCVDEPFDSPLARLAQGRADCRVDRRAAGLVAVDARAQMSMGTFHGYLTGHIGSVLGGDVSGAKTSGGASVSVQEATGWGAEFDFGRATDVEVDALKLWHHDLHGQHGLNLSVRQHPRIRDRRRRLDAGRWCQACNHSAKTFDLGLSAGGGVFLLANDVIGMRADARYFWSGGEHPELGRPDNLSHWRVSVGFTYLWSIAP